MKSSTLVELEGVAALRHPTQDEQALRKVSESGAHASGTEGLTGNWQPAGLSPGRAFHHGFR